MKRIILILLSIALLVVSGCSCSKQVETDDFFEYTLSGSETAALNLIMHDKYKARAIYQKAVDKFEIAGPFPELVEEMDKQVDELEDLFEDYELDLLEDTWLGNGQEFETLKETCESAVKSETASVNLYIGLYKDIHKQDIQESIDRFILQSKDKFLLDLADCAGL